VRDIVLLPIGGVSEIEGMGTSPRIETAVAIAGPLMSILIGGLCLVGAVASGASVWPPALSTGAWAARIGWLNLGLAAFNLVPALPMDGGRVLRSLLARRGDFLKATRTTAAIATIAGAAMIGYGLTKDYFLVLIGVFVLMGANTEWQNARVRDKLQVHRVGSLMHADATTAPADVPSSVVSGWLAHFPGRAIPVVDGSGRYLGIADEADLARAWPPDTPVGESCDKESPALAAESPITTDVLEGFRRRKQLAVVSGGHVVGVLYDNALSSIIDGLTASSGMGLARR
jgi:hypothetical protein